MSDLLSHGLWHLLGWQVLVLLSAVQGLRLLPMISLLLQEAGIHQEHLPRLVSQLLEEKELQVWKDQGMESKCCCWSRISC